MVSLLSALCIRIELGKRLGIGIRDLPRICIDGRLERAFLKVSDVLVVEAVRVFIAALSQVPL